MWTVAALAGLVAGVVLIAMILRPSGSEADAGTIRTAAALRGNFTRKLRLTGSTTAVTSYPIAAPRLAGEWGQMTIVHMQSNGAHVKRGDVLVEFDRQNEIENYLNHRATFMDLSEQVAKLQKNNAAAQASDETAIQTAEDQLKTAQLEMQRLELLARIDQEITRLQLAQAQASLQELRRTYKLKRTEAAAKLRDLELQRDQAQRDMLHSQSNEERMIVHSPISGVVVLQTVWDGGRLATVAEGDQVRPGQMFMEVVNPSEMEVSAKVNQMDVANLHAGQQAVVRLDAYPGLALPARLVSVGPIATHGQFSDSVRDFSAMFSVKAGDPRLMPDLSAAVDVDLDQQANAVMVPNDCIASVKGKAFVFVKAGGGFRRQEVTLGPQNNLKTVVQSGLKAGTVVERGVDQT